MKYFDAGVREYWIVDLFKRVITVYLFDKTLEGSEEQGDESIVQQVYSFEDEVPVHIYCGDLKISFPKIVRRIEQLSAE